MIPRVAIQCVMSISMWRSFLTLPMRLRYPNLYRSTQLRSKCFFLKNENIISITKSTRINRSIVGNISSFSHCSKAFSTKSSHESPPSNENQAFDLKINEANTTQSKQIPPPFNPSMGPNFEYMDSHGQRVQPGKSERREIYKKSPYSGGVTWTACILFGIIGGLMFYFAREKRLKLKQAQKRIESIGEANIGGKFSLVDHFGRPITSANLWGKYVLVYFGFTHCPDICPWELKKMKKALESLKPETLTKIQPVLITVDPWRDSVSQISAYIKDYHPKLIGLTGTPSQIESVTKNFRVYSSKGPEDGEDNYLVDHSVFIYLMDEQFKFIDYFGTSMEAPEISEKIQAHMESRGIVDQMTYLDILKSKFRRVVKS